MEDVGRVRLSESREREGERWGWEEQSAGGGHRRIPYLNASKVSIWSQAMAMRKRTGALLRLHEPRCTVNANDEAARDFWVKCTTVTSFFAT